MKIVILVITTALLFSPAYADESKVAKFDFEKIMAQYTFLSPAQVKTKWGRSKLKKEDFK
ncbi:MAG: hypothetical protein H7256_08255, partial [Bdellovibrio sp.]|nr:hypothetical protein [Bdellovibrio sp.]